MTKSQYTPEYKKLRFLIIAAREKAGLTQANLSARLGRPQSYVSKIESGERRLDIIELINVCRVLEADPLVILSGIMVGGKK